MCSRMISAKADPKMTTVPKMLPKIAWSFRQNGNATRPPARGGTVSENVTQYQFS